MIVITIGKRKQKQKATNAQQTILTKKITSAARIHAQATPTDDV